MSRVVRIGVGAANAAVAALVGWGVFRLLPARFWAVDFVASIVGGLLAASGVALLLDLRPALRITKLAATAALVAGLFAFAALVFTASWLAGVYGPVGKTGAILYVLVAALVLPYLVALPIGELVWLGSRPSRGAPS
jgi:hypothetical protein